MLPTDGSDDSAGELKRSSSCPDERHISEEILKKQREGGDRSPRSYRTTQQQQQLEQIPDVPCDEREFASSGVQTDEFVIFPYEHLFPMVLPQCFAGQQSTGEGETPKESTAEGNPYDILDQYTEEVKQKESLKGNTSGNLRSMIKKRQFTGEKF